MISVERLASVMAILIFNRDYEQLLAASGDEWSLLHRGKAEGLNDAVNSLGVLIEEVRQG